MTVVDKHILLENDDVMDVIIHAQDINVKLQALVFNFTGKYPLHINLKRDTLITSMREYLDENFAEDDTQELLEYFKYSPDVILSGLSIIAASLDNMLATQFDAFEYSVGLAVAATTGIYFRHHSAKLPESYKLH